MKRSIFYEYWESTKWAGFRANDLKDSAQIRGLPQPPIELERDPSAKVIDLPAPSDIEVPPIDLREAIERRRSIRAYSEEPITLEELSWLLWCTQGVKEYTKARTLRNVPSGGARHPFETYLLVNRVEGLQPGLYRFLALDHKLAEYELAEGLADKITEVCWGQPFIRSSAVTFIWTVVPYRSYYRYKERSFRNILEAGHICQNLHLSAEAVGCGVCAIGAFGDDAVNDILGVDGVEQFVVYMATVGKKK